MPKDPKDYYKILGVEENAALPEIKKAFRDKAKKIHPDTAGAGGSRSEPAMRELIAAYQVLRNKGLRSQYDEELRRFRAVKFDYREFLKRRSDDQSSQARLIFFDLLHGKEEEALDLYRKLEGKEGFSLEKILGEEDYMDCAFLLAEAFEKESDYIQAFRLLYRISELETEINYFKHFTEDVRVKVKNILFKKNKGSIPVDVQCRMLESIISMKLYSKEKANLLKKLAELNIDMGNFDKARYYLNQSLELKPGLAGTESMKKRLVCT